MAIQKKTTPKKTTPKNAARKSRAKKPTAPKRDVTVATTMDSCPRCGESVSIQLVHSYFGGKKLYRCWSETCKSDGVRPGKGRQFVVMPKKN